MLTTLQGVSQIAQVVKGDTATFSTGFPGVRFKLDEIKSEKLDNNPGKSNWRTYTFLLDAVMPLQVDDRATAEDITEDTVEAIINALESDWTLGGNCDYMELRAGRVRHEELPFGICAVMTLLVDVRVYVG